MIDELRAYEPIDTHARAVMRDSTAHVVVLAGGRGTGKSYAAAEWAIGVGARWVTSWELARTRWHDSLADAAVRVPYLVVDDVDPDDVPAHLAGLLLARYERGARTVLTINCEDRAVLARVLGVRMVDRMRPPRGLVAWVAGRSLRADMPARRTRIDQEPSEPLAATLEGEALADAAASVVERLRARLVVVHPAEG
jgi:hypothetical protein